MCCVLGLPGQLPLFFLVGYEMDLWRGERGGGGHKKEGREGEWKREEGVREGGKSNQERGRKGRQEPEARGREEGEEGKGKDGKRGGRKGN